MDVIGYSVLLEGFHGSVVGAFADVVGTLGREQKLAWNNGQNDEIHSPLGKGVPVPHESIFTIRPLYSGFFAIDWKTPSAIVERQMLPRQTKRTEICPEDDILAGYEVR